MPRDDADVVGTVARESWHAGVVRKDRDVGKSRLVRAKSEFTRDQAVAPGRVDKRSDAERLSRAALRRRHGEHGGICREIAGRNANALAHNNTHFARAIHENAIEILAADLIRLRPHDLSRFGEIDAASALAIVSQQARSPLFGKRRGRDLFRHTECGKAFICVRQQRLADVEAREAFPLQQHDRIAALGQRDGRRRSRRTSAGNGEIEVVFHQVATKYKRYGSAVPSSSRTIASHTGRVTLRATIRPRMVPMTKTPAAMETASLNGPALVFPNMCSAL